MDASKIVYFFSHWHTFLHTHMSLKLYKYASCLSHKIKWEHFGMHDFTLLHFYQLQKPYQCKEHPLHNFGKCHYGKKKSIRSQNISKFKKTNHFKIGFCG